MKRAIFSMLAVLVLSACGSGDPQPNATPAPANLPAPASNSTPKANSDKPEPPKEDLDKWKKVVIPTPKGWDKLAKDGQNELRNDKHGLLLKPGDNFSLLASFGDAPIPHSSSGTEEEWAAWRQSVSAVFIYNVSKSKAEPVAKLKEHGASVIHGFDAAGVRENNGVALYIQADAKEKWAACVSNERGTYILVALVRNEDAAALMRPYPESIKPE